MELIQILCLTMNMVNPPGLGKLPTTRAELACKMMPYLVEQSTQNKIRPTLLLAMIYVESGWKKTIVSPAKACGLTQVIAKYTGGKASGSKKYTCSQLKNPKISIKVGSRILNYWIYKYAKGNERIGLCGYNAGFRCKGKKPNKKGMYYAKKVHRVEKNIITTVNKLRKDVHEQQK